MVQPMNYAINVPDPIDAFAKSYNLGAGLRKADQEAQDREMAIEAQRQRQAALARLRAPDATSADYENAMLMVDKDQAETIRKTFEMRSAEENKGALGRTAPVVFALKTGNTDQAIQIMRDQAAAKRNAGDEDGALYLERYADAAKEAPEKIADFFAGQMTLIPGGKEALENVLKITKERREAEIAPVELSEARAKAQKAAVDAKFAESMAVKDLEKKGWDITKIQEDIKIQKENSRIAALNAQIAREANQVKREEMGLKLQEMQQKRDDAIREKVATVESARSQMDNMLNTADRILKTPAGVVSSAAGPISSRLPTTSAETADFEELVNTLGSQSFLAQIPNIKGMGALSNAEGEKLQAALQSFSLRQSPQRLLENVREAQRLILKGRTNLAKRSGIPDSVPDTPQAQPGAEDIDALLKKYGG